MIQIFRVVTLQFKKIQPLIFRVEEQARNLQLCHNPGDPDTRLTTAMVPTVIMAKSWVLF
jgi:hypothetical protein